MFLQDRCFLEISNLRPFCKHPIAVTVSEDAEVIDCMFVHGLNTPMWQQHKSKH